MAAFNSGRFAGPAPRFGGGRFGGGNAFPPLYIDAARGIYAAKGLRFEPPALVDHSSSGTRATTDATGLLSYTAGLRSNDHRYVDPNWVRHLAVDGDGYSNLVRSSEDSAGIGRAFTRSTQDPNVAVAPDGATTADKLVENTATGSHYSRIIETLTSGIVHTYSEFFKADERDVVRLWLANSVGWSSTIEVDFDLTNGTKTVITGTPLNYGMENVANDWWRLWVTNSTSSTSAEARAAMVSGGIVGYTGDGSSGVLQWGAMINEGHYPRAYAPTAGAIANVAAEVGTVDSSLIPTIAPGNAFTAIVKCRARYRNTGTAYSANLIEVRKDASDRFQVIISTSSGDTGQLLAGWASTATGGVQETGASNQFTYTADNVVNLGISVQNNRLAVAVNGSIMADATYASETLPDLTGYDLQFARQGDISYELVTLDSAFTSAADLATRTAL